MGTDKRERQKANRQLRLEELAREQQRAKTKRRAVQIGLLAAGLVVIVLIFFIAGRSDNSKTASSTTVAGATTTVATGSGSTTSGSAETVPATAAPATLPAGDTPCTPSDPTLRVIKFSKVPSVSCIDTTKKYIATMSTNLGDLTLTLDPTKSAQGVANFVVLARYHYFDGTICHRVVKDFVVQCGDPTGTGSGGPGYEWPDAGSLPTDLSGYVKGAVAMANSGPDTNGSQFFILTTDTSGAKLGSPKYALLGQETDDKTTLDTLNGLGTANEKPSKQIVIKSVTVKEA